MTFFRTDGWETGVLFPPFPSAGPRSQSNSNGGQPGEPIFSYTYFNIQVIKKEPSLVYTFISSSL